MLYSYFFNMLKVGVPGFTQTPQLLVYNRFLSVSLHCNSYSKVQRTDFLVILSDCHNYNRARANMGKMCALALFCEWIYAFASVQL